MTTVQLTHNYAAPARAVWDLCTDFGALRRVSAPLLKFRGLPDGRLSTGDIQVDVSLFGLLPWQPYRMTVVQCDDAAMEFRSEEHGVGVDRWAHHLRVTPTPDGARIDEDIDIEAGWKTPLVAAWAWMLYRRRHPIRVAMLNEHAARAA